MPVDLASTPSWKAADSDTSEMLTRLQANILKGHGRRATRLLFLRFIGPQDGSRAFLRTIEPLAMSASKQLGQAEIFKQTGQSGDPVLCIYLSSKGYSALGLDALKPQVDDGGAFFNGMAARSGILTDPTGNDIEPGYRGDIHAMVLIAGDPDTSDSWTSNTVDNVETQVLNLMSQAATVVASESGRAIFNAHGDGLEHFGYVDGRSQPLLVLEDVQDEQAKSGIDQWDPTFPLSQVLVPDPGGNSANAFGSFFVFRKLEQNVDAFKTAEDALGVRLKNGELAGATLVGRFEDGTPVEPVQFNGTDGQNAPITNNFNYSGDPPQGIRCPVHAHIRKTNPRNFRQPIMARRAIPYGQRDKIVNPSDRPQRDVGLLFMAHQSNLARQFEFTQQTWANSATFPTGGTGLDPIIGQGVHPDLTHFERWNDPASPKQPAPFGGFVRLKGGEYFFAPSKSMLSSL